ncbi:alpha-1,4-N-acetylglucosaminyltransferase-like [Dendrobates tinctorius]|uniref:alpha-1,4-N-acetylglucosaminyltransferase-like n=1 Tax=Dendrobates tinctorius TaxID=92724 RepID=UPI003CC95343
MLKQLKILTCLLLVAAAGFFMRIFVKENSIHILKFLISNGILSVREEDYNQIFRPENVISYNITPRDVLQQGNGILFVETTDRMDEPSLVLCSIEAAARVYPDRPVVFFMKGLEDLITEDDEKKAREHFPTLSSYKNIYFIPLRLEKLFAETPFLAWYEKIDPKREIHWTHVKSDACRFAMIWKYGGIYMDTDVISLRPIPEDNFLAAEHATSTSSSVFGLSPHHKLTWEFMENFVQNYKGELWGHQGPGVFTRVVNKHCGVPTFTSLDNIKCANVSYLHPERFYPIIYDDWKRYFEVWENVPTFKNSYALHLWNYMNKQNKSMVVGSKTLVEHLYQQYCPSTYEDILKMSSN